MRALEVIVGSSRRQAIVSKLQAFGEGFADSAPQVHHAFSNEIASQP
jgi:hypothetical protein